MPVAVADLARSERLARFDYERRVLARDLGARHGDDPGAHVLTEHGLGNLQPVETWPEFESLPGNVTGLFQAPAGG